MGEIFFLIILAIIWLVFATIQDLRKKEIANWLNFSLLIFALGFRFFYSLFSVNFNFFYQGLFGLGIFFILANILYYGRFFAGGDFKLMVALGPIIPFSTNFLENTKIFAVFFIFFFLIGAFYTILFSVYFSVVNFSKFKKSFLQQSNKNKNPLIISFFVAVFFSVLGFLTEFFFAFALLVLFLPLLYIYIKSVDESCLVKSTDAKYLREGDWLYKDVKVGKKIIKADWNGLSKENIKELIKSKKKVLVRHGIFFTPVFFGSFLALVYLWFSGTFENLWNSFW